MFATLTNVQIGACTLQKPIDNCCGERLVGLRLITFTVGWRNVEENEGFGYDTDGRQVGAKPTPGVSSRALQAFVVSELDGRASLTISKATGLATLNVESANRVTISLALAGRLSFTTTYSGNTGWFGPGEHVSDGPVGFAFTKTLCVHMEQLNTTNDAVNGAPLTFEFPTPEMKR